MKEHTDILNWRRRDARVTLSGQPTEEQLAHLAAEGVTRVMNLGPHTNDGALEDEAGTVARARMEYVYIPVEFEAPTEADFDAFCEVMMDADVAAPLHVHCIYNARVSAFCYRYAKEGRGGDVAEAFALMESVWRPGNVWATFIGKPENADEPHRYKGYEY